VSESEYSVILVQSTSHALRGEKVLERAGVACKLIPVPRMLASDCGACLRVARADREAAGEALRAARVAIEGLHDI